MVRFGSKRIKKSRQLSIDSQDGASAPLTPSTLPRSKNEGARSREYEDFVDDDVVLDDYPVIEDNDFSGERSVAQARASVMVYNNDIKKWEHAGGVGGLSKCHIYFNPSNSTYRIVGRKVNDNDVVLNCGIGKNLKYNKATPTFHQWRDQRQVYGLNFQSADDAIVFSEAVLAAVENINNPPAPEPVQQYQPRAPEPQRTAPPTLAMSRPPEPTQAPPQPPSQPPQPPKGNIPAPPPPPPPVNNIPPSTPAPPPPGPPPPPSGGGPPPPPPPPPSGGAPPPPPPPPPPSSSGGGGLGGGGGLAAALQGIQLKKRSESQEERKPPPPSGNPMDDMMSALNKKLLARKKMAETGGSDSQDGDNKPPPVNTVKASAPPTVKSTPAPPPVFNKSSNAPPTVKKTEATLVRTNTQNSQSSAEDLNSLKEEILQVVREEIQAAKMEIIEALRQQLSGR